MDKKRIKKKLNNIYILGFFFILSVLNLINFKKSNSRDINLYHKIENQNNKELNQNEKQIDKKDKFIITYNKDDLIEKQNFIAAEDAGELN